MTDCYVRNDRSTLSTCQIEKDVLQRRGQPKKTLFVAHYQDQTFHAISCFFSCSNVRREACQAHRGAPTSHLPVFSPVWMEQPPELNQSGTHGRKSSYLGHFLFYKGSAEMLRAHRELDTFSFDLQIPPLLNIVVVGQSLIDR